MATSAAGALTVEQAEAYSKPRLKRYVVERCIYGVDINPLAVELGRLALWVETMDRALPFGFLDHKVKCGNALVGCWFDQFQDYPIMAWEREAGDASHKGVHFAQKVWTKEIKRLRNEVVKDELRELLLDTVQLSMFEDRLIQPPAQTYGELRAAVEQIHGEVLNPAQQADEYAQSFEQKQALQQLRWAFDCWCAVWFWRASDLEVSPTPMQFVDPSPEVKAAVERVAKEYQFFHWELTFPDVFQGAASGFDAITGNPPWEIQKPNSKEFFSNIDPLYRTYGKQEALAYQQQYFEANARIEEDWLAYCARLKALSNWCKYVAFAFGDEAAGGSKFSLSRKKKEAELLATEWRGRRTKRTGYSDPAHPFRYQGSADINTYKMFAELGHALIREGGRFGLIVPSGLYTDKGSGSLRRLFLNRCEWTHLYAFQNERFVFGNIHHSFKMVVFSVNKGGHTKSIATRFRLGPGDSPEAQELMTDILDNTGYLSVPAEQIKRFSPNTGALLEIRTDRDLKILEKMYSNGVLLGDDGPQGWGIQYATEFHMTNDSKLFPPRPKWEAQGYRPDEYGHWLKGDWQPYSGGGGVCDRREGIILSADGIEVIKTSEIEDIALPLYQGVMVQQFDFSAKEWISGSGVRAVWKEIDWVKKRLLPQFLMSLKNVLDRGKMIRGIKPSVRRVARNSDTRTAICSLVADMPCGDKAAIFAPSNFVDRLSLPAYINSYNLDWAIRIRVGGTQLDYHIAAEMPVPQIEMVELRETLALSVLRLNGASALFANVWLELKEKCHSLESNLLKIWKSLWAITLYERLRLRCILDAIVAELYGVDIRDFSLILKDCDYPSKQIC